MRTKLFYIVVGVLLVAIVGGAFAAYAQEPTRDTCEAEAREWYRAIPEVELGNSYRRATNTAERISERVEAATIFEELATEFEAVPYPDCIEDARTFYLQALGSYHMAAISWLDEDAQGYLDNAFRAVKLVGQMRGYLWSINDNIVVRGGTSTPFR